MDKNITLDAGAGYNTIIGTNGFNDAIKAGTTSEQIITYLCQKELAHGTNANLIITSLGNAYGDIPLYAGTIKHFSEFFLFDLFPSTRSRNLVHSFFNQVALIYSSLQRRSIIIGAL